MLPEMEIETAGDALNDVEVEVLVDRPADLLAV